MIERALEPLVVGITAVDDTGFASSVVTGATPDKLDPIGAYLLGWGPPRWLSGKVATWWLQAH
jgi:hypothetical protein